MLPVANPAPTSILAIETSTDQVGVALLHRDRVMVRESRGMKAPSRLVYSWIRELLLEAGSDPGTLGTIVFGAGPGSFTGVRVATAVAQALGFARNIPVIPVSTLAAMARPHLAAGRARVVLSSLDARMGEIYTGTYIMDGLGRVQSRGEEGLAAPDRPPPLPEEPFLAVGPGFAVYPELLAPGSGRLLGTEPACLPDVRDVLAIGLEIHNAGQSVAADAALPNYIRSRVTR